MGSIDTRMTIIETAMDLFSRQGYSSTTTRSIAERADVNELTLFRHFGSKENLLSEVIDHFFDEKNMMTGSNEKFTGDPKIDLFRIVTQVRSNLRERKKLFHLLLREVTTNDIVARKLERFPLMMKEIMIGRIGEVLKGRVRKDLDLETAGVFLVSYFVRSEMMKIMLGEDPFHEIDDKRTREAIDIFLNGILGEA